MTPEIANEDAVSLRSEYDHSKEPEPVDPSQPGRGSASRLTGREIPPPVHTFSEEAAGVFARETTAASKIKRRNPIRRAERRIR